MLPNYFLRSPVQLKMPAVPTNPQNASIHDQNKNKDEDKFKEQNQKDAITIWVQNCCTYNLREITIKSPMECTNNILETS